TIGLLAVILFDLWPVKTHFNPFQDMKDFYSRPGSISYLCDNLQWEPGNPDGPYRIARSWKRIFPPNIGMMYGLDDFGGYDSNLVGIYGELLEQYDPSLLEGIHWIESPKKRDVFASKLWDMLGVKYILALPGHMGQFGSSERMRYPYINELVVVENKNALPRMHLTDRIIMTNNKDDALLKTRWIVPQIEAVVLGEGPLPYGLESVEPFKFPDGDSKSTVECDLELYYKADESVGLYNSPGSVVITDYQPEKVTATVEASRPSLVEFFDVYYPGWEVTVDGKRAGLERVDYAFKGVFVSEGKHEVIFSYKPKSLIQGALGSLIGLILTLILVIPLSKIGGKSARE
ncbi:MAG: YfhO family protein, partial [bacterium]